MNPTRRDFFSTSAALVGAGVVAGCQTISATDAGSPLLGQLGPYPTNQAPFGALNAQSIGSWTKLPTVPFRGKQDDISFVTADLGWYGNGEGHIYKTTDGGANWTKQLTKTGTFVRALGMVDAQQGFMGNVGTDYYPGVTDEQALYETRDGGQTWLPISGARLDLRAAGGAKVKGICAIDVLRKTSIYQGQLQERTIVHAAGRVGGPPFILRSLDQGQTWQVNELSAVCGAVMDVKFFDENNGLLCAATAANPEVANAQMLRTIDGGASWQTVYRSSSPFELCWKMSFPTREVGFATVQNYNPDKAVSKRIVIKTVDGGRTWQELPLVDDYAVRQFGIGFVTPQVGWLGTTTSGFQTLDGGASWTKVNLGQYVNKIRVLPKAGGGAVAYAIGADIYKLTIA
jgi:photosystem II stability/assembly factor-like uncharacterized protein